MYSMVTMYYDVCTYRRGDKVYRRELIRESFRKDGRVRKRTVANVTNWSEEIKAVLRATLGKGRRAAKSENDLSRVFRTVPGAEVWTDRSVGALYVLQTVAERLGLPEALGSDRSGRPALWQVFARLIDQGARLSAGRLARGEMVEEVPGLGKFTEDDLYENLDWLCAHQQHIEDRLFHLRSSQGERPSLFLYV